MSQREIQIVHLYPDLLNLYGDKGNIACMKKRLAWRGIDATVTECTNRDHSMDLGRADIIFVGGGSDREQEIVCSLLLKKKREISDYVESGGTLVAVCGGYQLLGNYYKMGDETIEGLGVVNIHTERGDSRLISNIVLQSDLFPLPIVGFENHGGRTFIEDYQPLGKVLSGHGNNDKDKGEGIVYKNVIGTYLHGPLLPKNPHLCDYLLQTALNRRFGKVDLPELDDKDELAANHYIVKRFAQSE